MIKIPPSSLGGTIKMQPSKSACHRMIICAALSRGKSVISNVALSDDISATLRALHAMGLCTYEMHGDTCEVTGGLQNPADAAVDCGESGSTLRFLLPLAFDGAKRKFTGQGRLLARPMEPYDRLFAGRGYHRKKQAIDICGKLLSGTYGLPGDVSSQFVTGLLFKLPLLEGDSHIVLSTPLESRPYVNLTMQILLDSNIITDWQGENDIYVRGDQTYTPITAAVEGDYSHAAFFAVAAALSGEITMTGLRPHTAQGDSEIFGLLKAMGAQVLPDEDSIMVRPDSLKPAEIDVSQIPDLFPALCVLACGIDGRTRLYGGHRLRHKESDRLSAMATELEKLGADVTEYEDSLVIYGTGRLRGGSVHSHGDHRIAMALTIASTIADGDILLDNPGVVSKSAPAFYDEFKSLGGTVL